TPTIGARWRPAASAPHPFACPARRSPTGSCWRSWCWSRRFCGDGPIRVWRCTWRRSGSGCSLSVTRACADAPHLPSLHEWLAAADETAAIDNERLPGDEVTGTRSEHDRDACDIVRLTDATQRIASRQRRLALRVRPQRLGEMCANDARCD